MEPITIGFILYGLYKGTKPSGPAAQAQAVADLASTIMKDGTKATDQIMVQLKAMLGPLGITDGGVGYPGGFTAYLKNTNGTPPWMNQADFTALSNKWNDYQHMVKAAATDGTFTQPEANEIVAAANAMAGQLAIFAAAQKGYQNSQAMAGQAQYNAQQQAHAQAAALNSSLLAGLPKVDAQLAPYIKQISDLRDYFLPADMTDWITATSTFASMEDQIRRGMNYDPQIVVNAANAVISAYNVLLPKAQAIQQAIQSAIAPTNAARLAMWNDLWYNGGQYPSGSFHDKGYVLGTPAPGVSGNGNYYLFQKDSAEAAIVATYPDPSLNLLPNKSGSPFTGVIDPGALGGTVGMPFTTFQGATPYQQTQGWIAYGWYQASHSSATAKPADFIANMRANFTYNRLGAADEIYAMNWGFTPTEILAMV